MRFPGSIVFLFVLFFLPAGVLCLPPALSQGVSGGRLPTPWDKDVSATHPWPEYPRPQLVRAAWQNLNGPWDYALTDSTVTAAPAAYAGKILVPYPYESALSGVAKPSPAAQRLWCRRRFAIPAAWRANGQHVLLHFGAVNWDSTVSVNGTLLGEHKGGYDAFTFDITSALRAGQNELVVSAWNPIPHDQKDGNNQVIGKQRLDPSGIFYTASTGIWQTVWLEPVPAASYIASLTLVPDIDAGVLHVTVHVPNAAGASLRVVAVDHGAVVGSAVGTANADVSLPIPHAHLWSPDDPHLYDLKVSLRDGRKAGDTVTSYFGMRKISLGKDAAGQTRIFLNNTFVFQRGVLDQGFWPDGIYTAPTDAAMRNDIVMTRQLGFNMCRKHAKVEPDRWYYWADRLGELVWQDMPQAFGPLSDAAGAQWLTEWKQIVTQRRNHPAIIAWTTFNEGWGQHDTPQIVAFTKQLDPSRLVNAASGWRDEHVGDVTDAHAYPGPWCNLPEPTRGSIDGEFGGVTRRVPDHMWTTKVMGYGRTLGDAWHMTQTYQKLLKAAYGYRDTRGMSGFVYTQLTDVEQESNGLMTYDRRVIKGLPAIVTAANQGQFLALPPPPPAPVENLLVPTSAVTPQTWRYTTTASPPPADWYTPDFDDSAWKTGLGPFGQGYDGIKTAWTDTPGDIWLRRPFTLPTDIPAKLTVLAEHDEDAQVYVNGVLAAVAPHFSSDYAELPMSDAARAALHPGRNTLAVHCHQTNGGQIIDIGIAAATGEGVAPH